MSIVIHFKQIKGQSIKLMSFFTIVLIVSLIITGCGGKTSEDTKTRTVDSYNDMEFGGLILKVPSYFETIEGDEDDGCIYAEIDNKLVMLMPQALDYAYQDDVFGDFCKGYFKTATDMGEDFIIEDKSDIEYFKTKNGYKAAKVTYTYTYEYESGALVADAYLYVINNPGVNIVSVVLYQSKEADYDYTDEIENMVMTCEKDNTQDWTVRLEKDIKDKNYYYAYNDLLNIIDMKLLPDADISKKAYDIGDGFAESNAFAPAALAYAKAGDYSDAEKKCLDSWDKGAFRNTACIEDYTAVGIRKDGTVVSAINTELINSVKNDSLRKVRAKIKIDTSGWENIISVKCNNYYYVGLTEDGKIKYGETGCKDFMIKEGLKEIIWDDIVSFDLEYGTLVALNKNGEVLVTGDNCNDFDEVSSWNDIVQISIDGDIITGVDIFGNVHVVNRYEFDEEDDENDPEYNPFTEEELSDVNSAQFAPNMYYGVYVVKTGELRTTTNEERAAKSEFFTAVGNTVDMDLDDYSGFDENDFVSCDANYDYYMGLRKNGSVRVGGHMGYIMEKQMGVSKLKDLKEAHLGIGSNPVVYGVTKDGTFEMAGYEGGDYMPYHERIRAWGELRKPTIMYDTSEFGE